MKSLVMLADLLLQDLGAACAIRTDRDRTTVAKRVRSEGEGFLTITLPSFGKAFEACLELGFLDPNLFPPTWRIRDGVPVFLQGFLGRIFDATDGKILDDADTLAVLAVRQITLGFGKLRDDCTPKRVDAALDQYIETDVHVARVSASISDQDLTPMWSTAGSDFSRVALLLWGPFLDQLDRVVETEFMPQHGPGSTADRKIGNQKWFFDEWSDRLDEEFPFVENALPRFSLYDEVSHVTFTPRHNERPVRIVTVPKTQKTPRVIAMEPSYMMYVQQGIHALIQREMERDKNTRSFWSYSSQEPNQLLAREGSISGALATLDLSEASDRVSIRHVWNIFRCHRRLFRRLWACRSQHAEVPGKGIVRLAKFASMGSALTFPLEAMVFTTTVFLGVERALGRRLTSEDIDNLRGQVRVYGDDIIVPSALAPSVVGTLEAIGFRVNRAKSFWTGMFRESCGRDWFKGADVSYAKIRNRIPNSRRSAQDIIGSVSLANQLRLTGVCPRTVEYIDAEIMRLIPLPWVSSDSALLGRVDPFDSSHRDCDGWDSDLHYSTVRGVTPIAPLPVNPVDGYPALLKFFLRRIPSQDPRHLTHSGRPVTVRLKHGRRRP